MMQPNNAKLPVNNPTTIAYIGKSVNRYIRVFFAVALVLMVIVAMLSHGIYDTGDGIMHYQFARWSWKHPELFLHHWAKPVFTLLASPFAQFGYKGVVLFNVFCHIGTAWLTWRIADRMKLPYAFLVGPLVIFAPISWGVAQSGLTEPLFALTLMLAIYFTTGARYRIAALVISFLPFIRSEGYLLVPLFALFFLVRKEFIPLALLATGTIVYSLAGGFFVHHDFLWTIHQNPYVGEVLYGHGDLFHFVSQNEFLFGWALTALIAIGICTVPFRSKFTPRHSLMELLLVFGSFIVFFVAHSIFWWKGLFGSYGLIRVIACVIPCAVLIAMRGLQLITWPVASRKILAGTIFIAVLGMTIFNTINHYSILMQPDERQLAAEEVARQIKELKLDSRLMYSNHPIMPYLLDKDPFDNTQCRQLHDYNSAEAQVGAIFVWDSSFGSSDYFRDEFKPVISIPDESDHQGMAWSVFEIQQQPFQ